MNPIVWGIPLADKCVPGPPSATHGADRISKNFYDAAGRLVESWEGVGTPLARREVHYGYNRNDQKTSLTDARGFRAEMTYDGHGRQSRWIFPSKTTPGVADPSDHEQYGYDPNGNRTRLRKRDGKVLGFDYDVLNRVTLKTVPEWGLNVRYSYDLRGLQTSATFTGTGQGVTNVYDGFGRMVSTTTHMSAFSRTVSHKYDREGRRIELTFPDGQKFWTARDGLGRATEHYQGAHGSTAGIMTAFAYNPAGQRSYFARRFGDMTSYAYDAAGRLTSQTDGFAGGVGSTQSAYAYTPGSQLRSESRSNDSYAWTGSAAVNRTYATNGQNQYTGTTVASGAPGATFAYDLNGNLTASVNPPYSTSYVYDSENRLVSASGSENATLVYDPLGRLFQIHSADTGLTQFLYDGDELVAEYIGWGNLARRYIHGDANDDPLFWYEGPGLDQPRFPHTNHQGSVTAVAGPGATPLWINTYDEYGRPGANPKGRFQYTGQAWIAELGLYYYKARFYSPPLGRFLQVDPIGYEDQVNLYAYVSNDSINGTDPTGTSCAPAGTQEGGAPAFDCKVDNVATVEKQGEKYVVTAVRPVNSSDGNKFNGYSRTYTRAANAASRQAHANPNNVITVAPMGPNGQGSFTTTSANMLREMKERRVTYANDGPSDTDMATKGGPGMGTSPTTYVYDNGLGTTRGGIGHEIGLHGGRDEVAGGLQIPGSPLGTTLSEPHQLPYNRAGCRGLGLSSPC